MIRIYVVLLLLSIGFAWSFSKVLRLEKRIERMENNDKDLFTEK